MAGHASRRVTWPAAVGPVVFTVLAHLLLIGTPIGSDEGGFAMVARFVDAPGPYLYGPQFVDRPPLLFAIFGLAGSLGADGTRIVAAVAAVVCVLACMRAAHLIAGRVAATWTGWTAAALTSSALLLAQQLNGEILAGALVATSIVAVLQAERWQDRRPVLALVAAGLGGASAVGAVLVKQDFADALAFAAVFYLAGTRHARRRDRRAMGAYVVGILAVLPWVLDWTRTHHGLGALLTAVYGVRIAALHSLGTSDVVQWLAGIAIVLLVLASVVVLAGLARSRTSWRLIADHRLRMAYLAAVLVEVVGVAGGGTLSPHYLLALVPTLSVAVGVRVVRARAGRSGRPLVRTVAALLVLSTVLSDPVAAVVGSHRDNPDQAIASWLRQAARPSDTIAVPFTNADVIDLSGLRPAYPYSWSLLVRLEDPALGLFDRILASPRRPTWIVGWDTPVEIGLAPSDPTSDDLQRYYTDLGRVCGHRVWLLKGRLPQSPVRAADCD